MASTMALCCAVLVVKSQKISDLIIKAVGEVFERRHEEIRNITNRDATDTARHIIQQHRWHRKTVYHPRQVSAEPDWRSLN